MARQGNWCVDVGKTGGRSLGRGVGVDTLGEGAHPTVIRRRSCEVCDHLWAIVIGSAAGSVLMLTLIELFSRNRLDCIGAIAALF